MKGRFLLINGNHIPKESFLSRRADIVEKYKAGSYLKNPNQAGPANPLTDPAGMEVMLEGMKKNMAGIIPQTLIFGWVNFFFSGFVLST